MLTDNLKKKIQNLHTSKKKTIQFQIFHINVTKTHHSTKQLQNPNRILHRIPSTGDRASYGASSAPSPTTPRKTRIQFEKPSKNPKKMTERLAAAASRRRRRRRLIISASERCIPHCNVIQQCWSRTQMMAGMFGGVGVAERGCVGVFRLSAALNTSLIRA